MSKFDSSVFKNKTGEWLKGRTECSDIVISSRIRLARNIDGFNFPVMLDKVQSAKVIELVGAAVKKSKMLKKNLFLFIDDVDELTRYLLVERHLASKEHMQQGANRAISFSADEIVSIMVNEEDHLRIQVLQSGFNLIETWRIIEQVDAELEKNLQFAFHPTLGYLTACPTNVGTGLRASCMLHLPSLVVTKQINKVLQAVSKLNLAVRGLYGEGTQASGNFFQFSNQVTLGKNEEQVVEDLEKIVSQIVEHEREARISLQSKNQDKLKDQIWRAIGALKSARIINSQETIALLSMVRLGIDLDIIEGINHDVLNELFVFTQPAHLQLMAGQNILPEERDLRRAQILRDYLKPVEL